MRVSGLYLEDVVMASAVTREEITKLVQSIDTYRKQVTTDRKEAKRVLRDAGIHTYEGKLKEPYRK